LLDHVPTATRCPAFALVPISISMYKKHQIVARKHKPERIEKDVAVVVLTLIGYVLF
jgi:hypothetical protein